MVITRMPKLESAAEITVALAHDEIALHVTPRNVARSRILQRVIGIRIHARTWRKESAFGQLAQ
jgi:hypothetical protein